MSKKNVVFLNAIESVGRSVESLLPGYPGVSKEELLTLIEDHDATLSRPVVNYGLLGVLPHKSQTFNISEHGFRKNGKEEPLWPPPLDGIKNVFVFGGSTILGYVVKDEETIPAQIEKHLNASGDRTRVYNFGYGNYTSRHEALCFLDIIDRGIKPDVIAFLDGFNECQYILGLVGLVNFLNQLYQSERRRKKLPTFSAIIDYARERLFSGTSIPSVATYEPPLYREESKYFLSDEYVRKSLAQSQEIPSRLAEEEVGGFCEAISELVREKYLTSLSLIRSIAEPRNIPVLFFWQPSPYFATHPSSRLLEEMCYLYKHGVFTSIVYRNWVVKGHLKGSLEGDFCDLSRLGQSLRMPLYIDTCHYTPAFCNHIAIAMSEVISNRIKTGS